MDGPHLAVGVKTSQQIRLTRLFKGAVYKENLEQLLLPIPKRTWPAPWSTSSASSSRPPSSSEN